MIHGDRSSSASRSQPRVARSAAAVLLAVVGVGGVVLSGCGSSSNDDPFEEFEGKWVVDVDTSTVTCSQTMGFGTMPFSPWSSSSSVAGVPPGTITVEPGVLTDLVETSGECAIGFNVKGKIATVPNPDPFTGEPPRCVIPVIGDGSSVVLTSTTTSPLTFQLDKPVAHTAQVAFIVGAADAIVTFVDSSGKLAPLPLCTFAAQAKLHKLTKP